MKIFRIFSCVFIAFSIVFTTLFGASKIETAGDSKIKNQSDKKEILTVWHIDTFEGGVGSRKSFLSARASEFEKKKKNSLFLVLSYTVEGAEENMKKGVYPDIISFGPGLEFDKALPLNVSKSFKGGLVLNDVYAVPWARGGYVLIENKNYNSKKGEEQTVLVSENTYNQPLLAAYLAKLSNYKFTFYKPLDAFLSFVSGKSKYLLGTQRDINRLENRELNYEIYPIKEFSDLYQYISITTNSKEKKLIAEDFINYLISKDSQEKLHKIGMFSPFYKISFENNALEKMQEININFLTISAFTPKSNISLLKSYALKAFTGDEDSANKIKNMII